MKRSILALALALVLLLSACGTVAEAPAAASDAPAATAQAAAEAKSTVISADEAHERMQSGDPIVILDVRTAEEYAEKHIPGAINIPNEDIGTTPLSELPVLDTEVLIYCRSGNRSAQATKKLQDAGYTNVYDFGGINSWSYETEAGEYDASAKEGTLSSFTAYDLNGIPVDESIFADYDLTMINIWATFCGPCLREMPELGRLAKEYADKGVQIVGIAVDVTRSTDGSFSSEMLSTARSLVAETGASYIHLLPSDDLVAAKLSQVSAVPETIFVDSEGKLVGESYLGARSGEAWAEIIDATLASLNG